MAAERSDLFTPAGPIRGVNSGAFRNLVNLLLLVNFSHYLLGRRPHPFRQRAFPTTAPVTRSNSLKKKEEGNASKFEDRTNSNPKLSVPAPVDAAIADGRCRRNETFLGPSASPLAAGALIATDSG